MAHNQKYTKKNKVEPTEPQQNEESPGYETMQLGDRTETTIDETSNNQQSSNLKSTKKYKNKATRVKPTDNDKATNVKPTDFQRNEESTDETSDDEQSSINKEQMVGLLRDRVHGHKEFSWILFDNVRQGQQQKVKELLNVLKEEKLVKKDQDSIFTNGSNDSILQTALHHKKQNVFRLIIKRLPDLIFLHRKDSPTALHVAVAMGDYDCVTALLKKYHRLSRRKISSTIDSSYVYEGGVTRGTLPIMQKVNENHSLLLKLLHTKVCNVEYKDTCLEGELPLNTAVWNTDKEMCRRLIRNGAKLEERSSCGDTVFHYIIRLSVKPEARDNNGARLDALVDIFHSLIKEAEELVDTQNGTADFYRKRALSISKLIGMRNNEGCTPLALAARLGAPEMFRSIIDVLNVYRFLRDTNGVSDVYYYDVTDIDSATVAHGSKSVLECIPDNRDIDTAFKFVNMMPIGHVIHSKWSKYSKLFFIWLLVHLCVMISWTAVAVARPIFLPEVSANRSNFNMTMISSAMDSYRLPHDFVRLLFQILIWLYGITLFILEIIGLKRTRAQSIKIFLMNEQYQIVAVIFSLSIVASMACHWLIYQYEHIPTIVSLITGWVFMLFFTQGIRKFSFFTALIQKVVFGDLLRFSVLIGILIVSFSAALHLLFKQMVVIPPQFETLWITVFSLFQLALGLDDVEVLSSSPSPGLSVTLFVLFVILAYVLSMNMLIAMVSESCSVIAKTKVAQWNLHKLKIMLMLEKRLPRSWLVIAGDEKLAETFATANIFEDDEPLQQAAASALGEEIVSPVTKESNTRYFFQVKTKTTQLAHDKAGQMNDTDKLLQTMSSSTTRDSFNLST